MRRPIPLVALALIVGIVCGFAAHALSKVTVLGTTQAAVPVAPADIAAETVSVPGVVEQVSPGGPILFRATAAVPTEKLRDWGPQPVPVGSPVSHIFGQEVLKGTYGPIKAGIWECTVGKWRRQIQEAEFAYFLEGDMTFTPDGGQPIEIKAGDTVWFPPHTNGIWDIRTKARKTFILIGPANVATATVAMLKNMLR
jgi:uncharacterized cupin superfamily protein